MEETSYFKDMRKEVSAIWDTVKADVKKEGEEIIGFDKLEQSKAKRSRGKALWLWVMQDQQNHEGADSEC